MHAIGPEDVLKKIKKKIIPNIHKTHWMHSMRWVNRNIIPFYKCAIFNVRTMYNVTWPHGIFERAKKSPTRSFHPRVYQKRISSR